MSDAEAGNQQARAANNQTVNRSCTQTIVALSAASILLRLQRGLETVYRVETLLDVRHYMVDDQERRRVLADGTSLARHPREQLLVSHAGGELSLGLYLDVAAINNLEQNDPSHRLGDHNFGDFCLAIEGVSHFIYVALCAAADRMVSALELELQAEVDKFVTCLLLDGSMHPEPRRLAAQLYREIQFADDLDRDERSRYETANRQARLYAQSLESRFLRHQRTTALLEELRRFYRLSLEEKLAHIACVAA